ncbi:hypothetical protein IFM89_030833 [Coptis chinensis]|uniref:Uncharacterized protein n=1 Tax=Coptis chinensis TaxID=261450 RepID=A0A835IES6_9MAGN|nr:hypothetical protein IFM89_030833 [Coptis chinensis]
MFCFFFSIIAIFSALSFAAHLSVATFLIFKLLSYRVATSEPSATKKRIKPELPGKINLKLQLEKQKKDCIKVLILKWADSSGWGSPCVTYIRFKVTFSMQDHSNAGGSMKTDDRDLALCSMILGIRTEEYGSKKVSSMRFSWGKHGWKASDQDECVICLERFKLGIGMRYMTKITILFQWHCPDQIGTTKLNTDAYGGAARDHERRVVFAYSGNSPTRSVILSDTEGRCTCYRETTRLADYLAMLIFGSTAPRIEYLHGFKTMSTTSKLICLSWMRSTFG